MARIAPCRARPTQDPARPALRVAAAALATAATLATAAILMAVAGCRNDPPTMPPDSDPWRAADLPYLNLGTSLKAIAFAGDAGYILGSGLAKAGTGYLLLARDPSRHWLQQRLVDPPDNAVLVDLAAGGTGVAVGGYLQQELEPCLVYDERAGLAAAIARPGVGIHAIDGDDALMVAGGAAEGGALWLSLVPGTWTIQATPLSTSHPGGFTDVFVADGGAWACGFDEGSDTPPLVLARDPAAGTWSRVPLGGGILGRELHCVAARSDGTMLVGGIVDAGSAGPQAFLRLREAGGGWVDLAIPDVQFLGPVNDVLPAADGTWFAACGGAIGGASGRLATILRITGREVAVELTPFHGAINQLGRDADGLLHAVGYRVTSGADMRQPLLLTRD